MIDYKKEINIYLDKVFRDNWSLSPEGFNARCERAKIEDPKKFLQKIKSLKLVSIIALDHVQFEKYK